MKNVRDTRVLMTHDVRSLNYKWINLDIMIFCFCIRVILNYINYLNLKFYYMIVYLLMKLKILHQVHQKRNNFSSQNQNLYKFS